MLQRHDAVDIPDLTMDSLKIFAAVVCLVVAVAAQVRPDKNVLIGEFGENEKGITGKVYRTESNLMLVENFYYKGELVRALSFEARQLGFDPSSLGLSWRGKD